MKLLRFCDWLIIFSFSLLFFLVPLILTPWNYELFEYNKMMLVYALTITITGSWLIKMVVHKKFLCQRTPFDLPIFFFLISQILSTIFSLDRHVSLFGYYSRFNGGLFSTISYLVLYYAFVSNFTNSTTSTVLKFLKISLLSALIVALYGLLEHFGVDKNLWVQDVQNRVFSTLGQPNWLGAYLAILIPIGIGFIFPVIASKAKQSRQSKNEIATPFGLAMTVKTSFYYLIAIIFYLCLLYTKSRSGLAGFWIVNIFFWTSFFFLTLADKLTRPWYFVLKNFLIVNSIFLILTLTTGTPWTPSLSELFHRPLNTKYQILNTSNGPALETGGTESGEIRKIVWQGAIEITRHYPLFGTGPETFAFSYYQFRPVAHNFVSEWDFLYNKAHNEYLNYAATTGLVGLGTYLLFIGWFLIWSLKRIFKFQILFLALFAAWFSILITNFFGFSVVIISLYFWLIPAFCVVILRSLASQPPELNSLTPREKLSIWQKIAIVFVLFSVFCSLFSVLRMWYADVRFNRGYQLSHAGYYQQAYQPFHEAIEINPEEPFYRDELSYADAVLAVAALQQKESTLSAQLAKEAIFENQKALAISPSNVNFYKTQTKVHYTLSSLDPNSNVFDQKALQSLQKAKTLAPTDPKITYNIALLLGRLGKNQEALKTLEEAIVLKPNYQDARFALALFYHEAGKKKEAISQLEYILKYISPTDKQIQEKLKEWGI